MSFGNRSGVHWIRLNVPPTLCAIERASIVLATPGTSSSRMWPLKVSDHGQNHLFTLADDHSLYVVDDPICRLRYARALFVAYPGKGRAIGG